MEGGRAGLERGGFTSTGGARVHAGGAVGGGARSGERPQSGGGNRAHLGRSAAALSLLLRRTRPSANLLQVFGHAKELSHVQHARFVHVLELLHFRRCHATACAHQENKANSRDGARCEYALSSLRAHLQTNSRILTTHDASSRDSMPVRRSTPSPLTNGRLLRRNAAGRQESSIGAGLANFPRSYQHSGYQCKMTHTI